MRLALPPTHLHCFLLPSFCRYIPFQVSFPLPLTRVPPPTLDFLSEIEDVGGGSMAVDYFQDSGRYIEHSPTGFDGMYSMNDGLPHTTTNDLQPNISTMVEIERVRVCIWLKLARVTCSEG